jgi:hypothetical protein
MKKLFQWGWLLAAIFSILTTPQSIMDAIRLGRSDHRLIPILLIAFLIRFAVTWLFLKLWWTHRASTQPQNSK